MRPSSLRIAAAGLLILPGAGTAQSQDAPRPFHAFVLTTGASAMSVDALNTHLKNAQFAGLSNDGVSYGASGYYAYGRAMLGADVARSTYGEEATSTDRSDALNSTQLLATASYALIAAGRVNVFPTLGVGAGRFDVILRNRATTATATAQPTFAEVVQSPGSESTVNGSHLTYSLGGGADYLITRGASDRAGVVFGVRAGMLFAPNRTTWTTGGRTVIAGPDASAGGPFLRIVVGIGGR